MSDEQPTFPEPDDQIPAAPTAGAPAVPPNPIPPAAPFAAQPAPPARHWLPPGDPTWVYSAGGGWQTPPSDPGATPPGPGWVAPPAAPGPFGGPAPAVARHRPTTAVAVTTVLAVVALGLGIGLGYVIRGTSAVTTAGGVSHPATTSPSRGTTRTSSSGFTSTTPRSGTSSTTTGGGSTGRGGGSTSSAEGSPTDLSAIAAKVDPGLVDINTTLNYDHEQAAGTGMVLTATGLVLTNNHVIDGATKITATDVGNGKTYSATVVGYDRNQDIAVIQLQDASGLRTVSLGDSSSASVGEGVVGIGNAGGTGGSPSVAGGSITALDQSITASDELDGTTEHLSGLIETNADVRPGDSGGPLVNATGDVLGMDTAGSESSGFFFRTRGTGQAYAIPIDEADAIAKQIVAGKGSATVHIGKTAFLGIEISSASTGRTSTPSTRFTTGSASAVTGVTIAGIVTGTPAAGTSLAKGDTITSIGGQAVTSADSLSAVLQGDRPGQSVTIDWVTPTGQKESATVTLANGPAD